MSVSQETYDELFQQREDALQRGNFQKALQFCEDALHIAQELHSQDLVHRAVYNRSAIQLELGDPKLAEEGLREVILRSDKPSIICGASYNLAVSMRRQKRWDRARFFAQMAMEKARTLDENLWVGRCHNLLGNLHLCQSDADGALKEYRKALQIRLTQQGDTRFPRAILLDNIGYCGLLNGEYRNGLGHIHEALELATEISASRCIAESFQDLCFGYMKLAELDKAAGYGQSALSLGEEQKYPDIIRNCYYLLSEVYHLADEEQLSDDYLEKLQKLFPDIPYLRDFLRTFDVSNIIALKSP
jgi:tetratricopeptide (TPR) repeat protein